MDVIGAPMGRGQRQHDVQILMPQPTSPMPREVVTLQRPFDHMRPPHPTSSIVGRHVVLQWRSTRGEGGTLGGIDSTNELLGVQQDVGTSPDPTQGDTNFDLVAKVRCCRAQRVEAADQPDVDIEMPTIERDPSVAHTPQELIK